MLSKENCDQCFEERDISYIIQCVNPFPVIEIHVDDVLQAQLTQVLMLSVKWCKVCHSEYVTM